MQYFFSRKYVLSSMYFHCTFKSFSKLHFIKLCPIRVVWRFRFQVLVVASVLGIYVQPINCANILAFFPLPIYSHISGFNPLFLELADRGHHVTVVSAFQPKGNVPSTYKHVTITNGMFQHK